MTDKLLQCPFCGGEAELAIVKPWNHVYCKSCHARTTMYSSEEQAIEAWNKRTNPWHTGTPTEEGDYLVKLDVEHHVYPYYVLKWANGWYSHYDMDNPACPKHSVIKWQKIEETE